MILETLHSIWYNLLLFFKNMPFILFQVIFLLAVWLWFIFYYFQNSLIFSSLFIKSQTNQPSLSTDEFRYATSDRPWQPLRLFIIIYLLFSSVLMLMALYFNTYNIGFVKEEKLALYVGPDKTYPIKNFLKLNDEVIIKQEKLNSEKWFYVLANQQRGWAQANAIKLQFE